MKNSKMKILALCILAVGLAANVYALPNLQLDIVNGVYDKSTQTTVATTDPFELIALLQDAEDQRTETYYLSVAVMPMTGSLDVDLGYITINGLTVAVTADMVFGTPPVEIYSGNPDSDLSGHGIYDTFYYELEFQFSGATTSAYNVQDDTTAPGELFQEVFSVDTRGLASGYEVHFDLYNKVAIAKRSQIVDGVVVYDIDAGDFAPFSHDAESGGDIGGGGGGGGNPVPEPSTILLLGLGLALFGWKGRRIVRE